MEKPVVLITGALTGIGRATAITFAKDGARVVVSGRRQTEGKALEAELRSLGAEAEFGFPTHRRVLRRPPSGPLVHGPTAVWIQIDDVLLTEGEV